MSAPKPFFSPTWSMSISMVLQNLIPIRYFLHNKWPQKVQKVWRKKKKQQKKKKVGKPIGDPVGGRDAPIILSIKCYCKILWYSMYSGLSLKMPFLETWEMALCLHQDTLCTLCGIVYPAETILDRVSLFDKRQHPHLPDRPNSEKVLYCLSCLCLLSIPAPDMYDLLTSVSMVRLQ